MKRIQIKGSEGFNEIEVGGALENIEPCASHVFGESFDEVDKKTMFCLEGLCPGNKVGFHLVSPAREEIITSQYCWF